MLSSIPKKIHAVNPQFSSRFRIFVAVEVVSGAFPHSTHHSDSRGQESFTRDKDTAMNGKQRSLNYRVELIIRHLFHVGSILVSGYSREIPQPY